MADENTAQPNTNAKPTPKGGAQELPSAFSLFSPSWEAVQVNIVAFIFILLVPIVVVLAGVLLSLIFHDTHAILYVIWAVLGLGLIAYLLVASPGLVYTQLQAVRKNKVEFQEALEKGRTLVWKFLGLSLLVGLIVIVGFILLIVPGFFMIKRYLLSPYFLVDKNLSIGEAMRASADASKQYSGAIWGVLGVEVLIAMVSAIPFIGSVVNLVLSVTYYCAPALRYQQVTAKS